MLNLKQIFIELQNGPHLTFTRNKQLSLTI